MRKFSSAPFAKAQAPRTSAAEAKAENERYQAFQSRLERIAAAVSRAGREELAEELADLGQRVEDRETTLDEGMAELRNHEATIRAMLKK
jgi:DNA repair exonuclease SbcCD ATPase subunit